MLNTSERLDPYADIYNSCQVPDCIWHGGRMIFDIDGRGHELFPTVYALWKVPHLFPAFTLKDGEVPCYVVGGADLMFPGISIPSEGFPSFEAGQPWSTKVPGNPAPIAVGTTTMSSSEASKAGLRGKALRIAHYYMDMLWDSANGCYVPNEGFYEDIVVEDPSFVSTSQSPDSSEEHAEGVMKAVFLLQQLIFQTVILLILKSIVKRWKR